MKIACQSTIFRRNRNPRGMPLDTQLGNVFAEFIISRSLHNATANEHTNQSQSFDGHNPFRTETLSVMISL